MLRIHETELQEEFHFIHSFSYLPGIDATILRSEADADFEDLAFVVSKPAGIGLFLNLLKGGLGGIVYLDLNDVDILPGLEQDVNPAIGGSLLHFYILSHELQNDVHRILEILLRISLNLIAGLGKERLQLLHKALGVSASDITGHSGNKCIGRFSLNRSIEIQKVVQKTVLDFFVREADLIEFILFVVILDGQIAGLI